MTIQQHNELKESIQHFINRVEDGNYSFDKAFAQLDSVIGDRQELFIEDEELTDKIINTFENLRSYDEVTLFQWLKTVQEEYAVKNEYELEYTAPEGTRDISAGALVDPNAPTASPSPELDQQPQPMNIVDKIMHHENEGNSSKVLSDVDIEWNPDELCEEYNYRIKNDVLWKINDNGKALYKAAVYKKISSTMEIPEAQCGDKEAAEIAARMYKASNPHGVRMSPPVGPHADVFMQTYLVALLDPNFGFEPDQVIVPDEYVDLKNQIVEQLHRRAGLDIATPEELEAAQKREQEAPVEPEQEEPQVEQEAEQNVPEEAYNTTQSEQTTPANEVEDLPFDVDEEFMNKSGSSESTETDKSSETESSNEEVEPEEPKESVEDFIDDLDNQFEDSEPEFEEDLDNNQTVDMSEAQEALDEVKKDSPSSDEPKEELVEEVANEADIVPEEPEQQEPEADNAIDMSEAKAALEGEQNKQGTLQPVKQKNKSARPS